MANLMVVDDSATMRVVLKKPLEEAGHTVAEAEDGADALNKIHSGAVPDIIISDVNMPNIDGITFCQRIKNDEKYKHIPFIIVSTEAGQDMKAKGKEVGVTAWMTKPPNPQKLVEAVAKIYDMFVKK